MGEIVVQQELLTQEQLNVALDIGMIADNIQGATNICRPCCESM